MILAFRKFMQPPPPSQIPKMNLKLEQSFLSLILTVLMLIRIPSYSSQNDSQYQTCSQPFQCGSLREIGYPFWGGNRPVSCGYPGFQINCQSNIPLLNISSTFYRVLNVDKTTRTLRIAREDLWDTICPTLFFNTTLNFSLFDFSSAANDQNITLYYGCGTNQLPPGTPVPFQFSCNVNGVNTLNFYTTAEASGQGNGVTCSSNIYVPVNRRAARDLTNLETASANLLPDALRSGFTIQWSANNDNCNGCARSGGLCGYNEGTTAFACYCTDRVHEFTCDDSRPGNGSRKVLSDLQMYVIIGVSLGIAGLVISSIIIFYIRKQFKLQEADQKKKLGKGGYGIVYKGKLPNGQLVAVKVLTETDNNTEEFINEVASISRTSHVNIVNLLGFCYDRKKRVLVYEYMPNKSLDKFICKSGSIDPGCQLDWETLYGIAVGIARGLEYLHRGCNTRIVHFDIKPQNILLDEEFCPKISDFGLAKLFKKKQSIISMLGARGTVGYIAPEVFSRNFGAVSHKSDVYSYGMMLLEMAGARNFDKIEAIQSSEDYFPDKIYEHVALKNEKLDDLMTEEQEETARKMLLVGLWCIQTAPSDRPAMTKVVEMLEGSLESIKIPPKPFLSSPKLSGPQFSSSVSVDVDIEI
ncbi:LEAF RUST 10 DISEASE-RESISTANCE LOCUS RECEPTOR-LIKE PROTEIN KINASE-like 2.1 isoform X2 [Sesamum indicum]|uniref:non-specific serine/threonine protein kinase n=1 Tax=Sesamum indicum TaxID=4182 RepID=A0A8M8VET4_SESIN|nr:LEAF RUST 10 DISEASE-RESISTANCE LOCUS RECEPTOR-LIKE PROTEIN KINASE-like 2.1 isoform X2 [Sesamum indicum]